MPNHKHALPVVFNYKAIFRAFANDPHVLRAAMSDEGYPSPTLVTVYQWMRSDREYIAREWLPLVLYVGMKTKRLGLGDIFAKPPANANAGVSLRQSSANPVVSANPAKSSYKDPASDGPAQL